MRTPVFSAVTALVLFLLCSSAMAQSPEAAPAQAGAPRITLPADISDQDLALWSQKLSAYAQGLNSLRSYTPLADDFFAWEKSRAGGKTGAGDEGPRWGTAPAVLTGSGVDAAVKKNKGIALSQPEGDKALEQLAASATAVRASAEEIKRYFDRKDFMDDGNGARLQQLSTSLREHYAALNAAQATLNAVHEQVEAAVSAQSLARFEKKHGRKYYWQHGTTMRKALAVMGALENVPQIDKAEFDGAAKDFKTALDEFEAYYNKTGAEGLKKEVSRSPLAPRDFDDFLAAVRSLQAEVDGGKPQNDIIRAANNVVYAYNSLVNSSNRTVFIQQ